MSELLTVETVNVSDLEIGDSVCAAMFGLQKRPVDSIADIKQRDNSYYLKFINFEGTVRVHKSKTFIKVS